MNKAELKQKVWAAVDANREKIISIGETIWKNPEPGFREYKTSKLAEDTLKDAGFQVKTGLGITGLRADLAGGGGEGPTAALLGELDSLILPGHPECDPETGAVHACGHNVSMTGMLGTAIALKESGVADELAGTIAFIATPAEECIEIAHRQKMIAEKKITALGGKADLIRRGVFDDVDLSFMLHSAPFYSYGPHNGFISKSVTFRGVACHAAAPGSGCNALHASALFQNAVGLLRERWAGMNHSVRVHGIITSGGSVVNIIPDRVDMEYLVRADDISTLEVLDREFNRAAAGCAAAVGAGVDIQTIPGYMPQYDDHGLEELYCNAVKNIDPGAYNTGSVFRCSSTDMGDLSTIVPTLHAYVAGSGGTGHGVDFHIADKESSYIKNVKILTSIVIDLMADGAAVAREVAGRREGKLSIADYIRVTDKFNSLVTRPVNPEL